MWSSLLCAALSWVATKHLKVSSHDLAGLLVESLSVPVRVEFCQDTHQTVVLTHQQCVQSGQSDVLIDSFIAWETKHRNMF